VDGLWAPKSEGVGLIARVIIVSKISNLFDPDLITLQTDGRTDGQHAIAIVHRTVKTFV